MKSPAFAFYVRDWMCSRKVASMTGDQVKAYMYLLCEAWLQEPRASLPMDDDELAEMARVSRDKWDEMKPGIMRCFIEGECEKHTGRYYNERQLEVSNLSDLRALNRKNKTKSKIKQNDIKSVTAREDEDEREDETSSSEQEKNNHYIDESEARVNNISMRDFHVVKSRVGGDEFIAARYFFRARNADNPAAFIMQGLKDGYIREGTKEEDTDDLFVKDWIDKFLERIHESGDHGGR